MTLTEEWTRPPYPMTGGAWDVGPVPASPEFVAGLPCEPEDMLVWLSHSPTDVDCPDCPARRGMLCLSSDGPHSGRVVAAAWWDPAAEYRCPICGNDPCTCNELLDVNEACPFEDKCSWCVLNPPCNKGQQLSPGEPGPYTPPGPCIPEPPPDRFVGDVLDAVAAGFEQLHARAVERAPSQPEPKPLYCHVCGKNPCVCGWPKPNKARS